MHTLPGTISQNPPCDNETKVKVVDVKEKTPGVFPVTRPDVSSAQATPSTSSVGSKVQSSTVTSHPSTTELADPLFVACPSPAFVDVSTHRVPPPVETIPARALKSLENDDGELDLDRLFSSYMCNSGVLTLTGIKMSVFRLLLSLLPPVFRSHGLSKENCLLTFLLQMKTGMASYTVETLFCIPRATEATNIFHTCMSHLKESTQQFIVWPDKKAVISTMPDKFTTSFSNCRVILYCLAVHLEPPNWSDLQSGWYKSPSERCRKMIIGFTPLGTVSFVSKSFPGDTTFANLILKSGVLDLIEPEDGVYVVSDDEQREEFDWEPLIADPRLKCISVFKPNDTLRKASIWAHSMHQIRRLKSYKILYNFSWELRETVESVVNMACVLANLQPLQ
ncbi:hypothetical protein B566_EDAN010387 [Ephemera danica]|nr:hypothetical protein B566_EDAN010387 [Ephemera danica]